jgi:two-component system invasion response regulator UvrY
VTVSSAAHADNTQVELLLVDNRQLVRAGIQRVLEDAGYPIFSGEAASCGEALRLICGRQPGIVLVNLHASAIDVLDGVRNIRRQMPSVRVLVLTEESDLIVLERLLQTGVSGCICSRCSVEEMLAAIEAVLGGEQYVSEVLAQKLSERRLLENGNSVFDHLTHRELQILLLLAQGKKTSVIARDLCLTRKTVNGHRNRLLEKLHAETDVELMHIAARHGLVSVQGAE